MMCTELAAAIHEMECQFGNSALENSQIQQASPERRRSDTRRFELLELQAQVNSSDHKSSVESGSNDSSRNHTVSPTCKQSQGLLDISPPSLKAADGQEVSCLRHNSNQVLINVSEEAASMEGLQKLVEKLSKELETVKQEAKLKGKTSRHLQRKVDLYELASSARANKVRKLLIH